MEKFLISKIKSGLIDTLESQEYLTDVREFPVELKTKLQKGHNVLYQIYFDFLPIGFLSHPNGFPLYIQYFFLHRQYFTKVAIETIIEIYTKKTQENIEKINENNNIQIRVTREDASKYKQSSPFQQIIDALENAGFEFLEDNRYYKWLVSDPQNEKPALFSGREYKEIKPGELIIKVLPEDERKSKARTLSQLCATNDNKFKESNQIQDEAKKNKNPTIVQPANIQKSIEGDGKDNGSSKSNVYVGEWTPIDKNINPEVIGFSLVIKGVNSNNVAEINLFCVKKDKRDRVGTDANNIFNMSDKFMEKLLDTLRTENIETVWLDSIPRAITFYIRNEFQSEHKLSDEEIKYIKENNGTISNEMIDKKIFSETPDGDDATYLFHMWKHLGNNGNNSNAPVINSEVLTSPDRVKPTVSKPMRNLKPRNLFPASEKTTVYFPPTPINFSDPYVSFTWWYLDGPITK